MRRRLIAGRQGRSEWSFQAAETFERARRLNDGGNETYLEIGIARHSLERADNVKRARSRVHHFRLSAVPGTVVNTMSDA